MKPEDFVIGGLVNDYERSVYNVLTFEPCPNCGKPLIEFEVAHCVCNFYKDQWEELRIYLEHLIDLEKDFPNPSYQDKDYHRGCTDTLLKILQKIG